MLRKKGTATFFSHVVVSHKKKSLSPFLKGFTLIELVIAIAVSSMIAGALYLSLKTAFDSWEIAQDRLILQQVSSNLMEIISEGPPGDYGLRDSLELVDGSNDYVSVVMPWTDDTHAVYTGIYTYSLNKHLLAGTSSPLAEALLPGQSRYRVIPIRLVDPGKTEDYPQVFIREYIPAGTQLRFTFHPNYKQDGDVVTTYRYESGEQAVYVEDFTGRRNISANPFGVKISEFQINYFNNTNTELGHDGSVSNDDIPFVTAVEINFAATSRSRNTRHSKSFISMRNAPWKSGNIILKEGTRFPIPNSENIKALTLTNLWGIDNKQALVLEAKSSTHKSWVLTIIFSKASSLSSPLIDSYTIEYPEGNKVYTDSPHTPVEANLNLLTLGPAGMYDYDNDLFNDVVDLDGDVELEVKRMDITGASLFVKP